MDVWVLSNEAPFDDWEEAGGCVMGVYATMSAALSALANEDLGEEKAAAIRWSQVRHTFYADSPDGAYYVLRRHTVIEYGGGMDGWYHTELLPRQEYFETSTDAQVIYEA